MDGFGERGEVVAHGACSFEEIDGGCLTGEEQDLAHWEGLGDGDGEIDAAHPRHHDVGDEEVGGGLIRENESARSVVSGHGGEAAFGDDDGESVRNDFFVVDYEDDRLRSRDRQVVLGNFGDGNDFNFQLGRHNLGTSISNLDLFGWYGLTLLNHSVMD